MVNKCQNPFNYWFLTEALQIETQSCHQHFGQKSIHNPYLQNSKWSSQFLFFNKL